MTSSVLWRTRYQTAMAEMTKYTRYMANGGLLFTVYFVVLYGLVVYGRFLDQLNPDFPGNLVMGSLFILLAFYRSTRTFLVEADQVFLLPSLAGSCELYEACSGLQRLLWIDSGNHPVFGSVCFICANRRYDTGRIVCAVCCTKHGWSGSKLIEA